MRWLVSIVREVEVEAWNEDQARSLAIELDGRAAEVVHVQAERIKATQTEAQYCTGDKA